MKITSVLSVLVMAATLLSPIQSYAHRCHYHGPGYYHCHDDADDFLAILILWLYGALLTTTTMHAIGHPAETLNTEAANYLVTGEKGAVFLAFAKEKRTELLAKAAAEGWDVKNFEAEGLTEEKIDQTIAEFILKNAS
jgi:hypothetical protein